MPDERSSFFFLGKFLTPTILVFTQLVQIESVNAEISKDSRAGVRKAELHLYCMSQPRVHIICFLSFLAGRCGGGGWDGKMRKVWSDSSRSSLWVLQR